MGKTYHIITIGCQMNVSDSERIAAYLESRGFANEPDRNKAGLVILNTCGVRQSAENRIYGLIPEIKKKNPRAKIILTGCLAERKDVKKRLSAVVDIWLLIKNLPDLYRELHLAKKQAVKKDYLDIIPKVNSDFSVFIPIGNGCDNFCSYCVVPYARGREQYRPAYQIIAEAEKFIRQGYKELFLIAQNVNSYKVLATKNDLKYFSPPAGGKKIGEEIKFPELLKAVAEINQAEKNFWVRFATSHPKDLSDKLIKVMAQGGRLTPYLHLPAQAGDDKILQAMNRRYTAKHYLSLIKKIRKAIPHIGLSTDIIVGFPGETKKQFANTAKLMAEAKFDMAYIACYSPRPGTAAFKLKDDIPEAEKKQREKKLLKILRQTALANGKKFLSKKIVVLAEARNKKGEWLGKNAQYKTVKFSAPAGKNLAGKFVLIKITKVRDFGWEGELIK
jgi:tRNA-2-methylthio-N6-dimethylallyladenosine synthase